MGFRLLNVRLLCCCVCSPSAVEGGCMLIFKGIFVTTTRTTSALVSCALNVPYLCIGPLWFSSFSDSEDASGPSDEDEESSLKGNCLSESEVLLWVRPSFFSRVDLRFTGFTEGKSSCSSSTSQTV